MNNNNNIYSNLIHSQRDFFSSKVTLNLNYRKKQLKLLYNQINKYEEQILNALKIDLNKSKFEAYSSELSIVYQEISYMLKNLDKLNKPKRKKTPLIHFPSNSYTIYDPYGCVLIIAPWNYPFQLSLLPLIGAIAAGNCAILKPSEYSQNTTNIIYKILDIFPNEYISIILGGPQETNQLLDNRFDYIFFTGSTNIGQLVMEKATRYLTPITLELGGKCPCIVDKSANIKLSAKRIVWGKLLNAGQTCVAPDYILVHKDIKEQLIQALNYYNKVFFGNSPHTNPQYPKIINKKHYDRLCRLIPDKQLVSNQKTLQIPLTIIDNSTWDDLAMQEEIFGPILPILTFDNLNDIINIINSKEKPLALYLFTTNKQTQEIILKEAFFAGGCINDTIIQVANKYLPFGGVGYSGMGNYHGQESFYCFSHTKSIMKKSNLIDFNARYAPYENNNKLRLLKALTRKVKF